jgi:hypothetical protein
VKSTVTTDAAANSGVSLSRASGQSAAGRVRTRGELRNAANANSFAERMKAMTVAEWTRVA